MVKYHALVIGNNDYKHLPDLKTAKSDAESIAKILEYDYGFDVRLMLDVTRDDILDAFDSYREKLGEIDNLLIYYAGHGWLDEAGEQGYWLPVDAKENRRSKWLSNATLTSTLKALEAKHVMVVADSCFSGTLVRGLKVTEKTPDYVQRMAIKRARVVLTSGGLEPVADLGGSGHSPFAKAFIDVLNGNRSVIDGTSMFTQLRRSVMLSADQTPEYSDARKAGHDGGDFLFVRRSTKIGNRRSEPVEKRRLSVLEQERLKFEERKKAEQVAAVPPTGSTIDIERDRREILAYPVYTHTH